MKKYFTKNGEHFMADFYCAIENGKTYVDLYDAHGGKYYFHKSHHLTAYYRHERTWDDHMGNTECGYYVVMPLPHNNGTKRVYIPFR